ncbi:MAG TPA: hypothetical protein VMV10_14665 [Pirellulales bacterium]|nr:hypothetical protein [Pirellulales bacterium]
MADELEHAAGESARPTVELPAPTAAPMVLCLGLALAAAGLATNRSLSIVGGVVFAIGLGRWIACLLPGRGHLHEPVDESARPAPIVAQPERVKRLAAGMPGYRLRLPEQVHPISAGVKGGLVGGLVMPLPALTYGVLSGHGLWYPVNLLAGMALPGVGDMTVAELEKFNATLLVFAILTHVVVSLIAGLVYGVLMPTLPELPKPLAWGGLLMPLLWTGVSFSMLRLVNPIVSADISWPWFVVSQFLYGVVSAAVVLALHDRSPTVAGLKGGLIGGLVMPTPAILWSLSAHHGVWYPANLLAAMVSPGMAELPLKELEQFHADWLVIALAMHVVLSAAFGAAYGIVLPRLWTIPASLAWGGLVMPLLWMASSYGLMGVVNPALQQRVDWPWFVLSQFIFGVAAAMVVVRSEMVHIAPAGSGEE